MSWRTEYDLIVDCLLSKRRIAAVTGAGISVASGLPLARQEFEGVPISKILTRHFFLQHPNRFYRWYRHCIVNWPKAKPNQAHLLLDKWRIGVVTQNIDTLHSCSPTSQVLELHGSIRHLVCPRCGQRFLNQQALEEEVPLCPTCNHLLHPDIVFVGEPVRHFAPAVDLTCRAKLLLVIGTKLEMYPCAQLVAVAKRNRMAVIHINKESESILLEAQRRLHQGVH